MAVILVQWSCLMPILNSFIDANICIRAERRTKELLQAGQSVMFQQVLKDLQKRDIRDRSRSTAPLRPAGDAIIIDTSVMNADAVMNLAMSHIVACSDSTS